MVHEYMKGPWETVDQCKDFALCSKCSKLDLCWNATIIDQRIVIDLVDHLDDAQLKKLKIAMSQVKIEYMESYEKHGVFNSLHEAYAVIKEEFDEMWFRIMNTKVFPKEGIIDEAAQVAAMCLVLMTDFEHISRNYQDK